VLEIPRLLSGKYCYTKRSTIFGYNFNNKYTSCKRLFFPLIIGMSLLMTSIDRNAILIDKQQADLFHSGDVTASTLSHAED
jgi:hypothetical protein